MGYPESSKLLLINGKSQLSLRGIHILGNIHVPTNIISWFTTPLTSVKYSLDPPLKHNAGKTLINHPFGNGLYHLFIVKLGMVYGIVLPNL